ncbi:hypothetical protein JYU29_11395 [Tianweitania sp. BSSL-BM11]|uniref:Uncharacterized protein n=1 Tax=Tianweitania aestuarii TaxID=2814886 RepID=A0ABS5RY94_9HYPH|nr:hypothetical protein [Tianweitania aestuarii]MBS9721292.1 hypothetical protein [Tianweitania aestuarii]
MAEARASDLVTRLQTAKPRNLNALWDLGNEVHRHLGLAPFHTVGPENPVLSLDGASALMKLLFARSQPHLFMSINGLMNPPHEVWRVEIGWPHNTYRGRAKSPALALCIATLRAHQGHAHDRDDEAPAWVKSELWQAGVQPFC